MGIPTAILGQNQPINVVRDAGSFPRKLPIAAPFCTMVCVM
jgi:hypothetical protein